MHKSDVDRDSSAIEFVDHHIGDSWYGIEALYSVNSDGHTHIFNIDKPFFSLQATGARGMSYLDNDRIDSLWDRGEIVADFRHRTRSHEIYAGWSKGLTAGWTHRYTAGVAYDENRFSPVDGSTAPMSIVPDDRKLVYPFVGVEFVQDRFEQAENFDQIKRVEDRYLGTTLGARLGYASPAFGSDRDAWLISAKAKTGFGSSLGSSLLLAGDLGARWERGGLHNFSFSTSAKYYKRQSERRLFYASLAGTYGHNLDVDNQLYLGGDNGLRGYPLRYQGGDKSALLTVEQRFFTDWYPFRLFRVGAAVFFDAGRTWGSTPVSSGNFGIQKDVGFGLRLGNSRAGFYDMIHVDLAFPLDSDGSIDKVQFVIETKRGF
ncbi:MAG: BamA/TamA family outer membrane protein [Woeseia sp.]